MHAMVLPRFGGSELFEMHELERPDPGCGEALVHVVASAVNPVDAKLTRQRRVGQTGSAGDFRLRRCRCRGRGWTRGERVSRQRGGLLYS